MSKSPRSSLWADVVLNLALITVVTLGLNAVLIGKLVQGREAASRADFADDMANILALQIGGEVAPGQSLGSSTEGVQRALNTPFLSSRTAPYYAVVVSTSLTPLASIGEPPWRDGGEVDEGALTAWLMDAHELRQTLASGQGERSEWQKDASFFAASWATASQPVRSSSGAPLGAVRVAVPVGRPLLGPMTSGGVPILAASVLISAAGVGLFGFVLFRRRILRPVEELVAGTRRVGQGEFGTRLSDSASNEIGELAEAFNEMALSLQGYKVKNEEQLAELQAINADLSQAREDLIFAEKMATVGRLAAGVAHEVGNPLASVIGFVELLQTDPDGDMARDLLPRIKAELDRINGIIRDLLAYSRPTGLTHTDLEPLPRLEGLSLPAIIDDVCQLVRLQPRFGDVEVVVDLPEGLPDVVVPGDRLNQVLLNLLVNAAEAMGGQGRVLVRRVSSADPEMLTIEIEDEGPGIDPKAASNIYEPFFTTKEVGDGTGLGLAVSLRLVEKMGGKLRHLRDRVGGATFHLSLPTEVVSVD